ncbi:helix-turn-helix transcriptional regulator [Sanguibacter suaedae]|uniref:MarR family transcriptional regulator n=1 Tax=Sanguibacter suaedae TaxID=2795737 RepID=A0A934I9M4_9MICO|nr:MarR family transcriptional regulator [Sanguibacter suaedae]MBI9114725.1 MarR family transcriptional regulator [Sanguibacter suaedae]
MENNRLVALLPEEPLGPRPARFSGRRRVRLTRAQSDVLAQLVDQPEPCTAGTVAAALHQHTNTVREHLDALVAVGEVERERAEAVGRGRPAWLYRATARAGLSEDAREYASLAAALAGHIARTSSSPAEDATTAGTGWGRDLARTHVGPDDGDAARPLDRLVTVLDSLGFDPEVDTTTDATDVRLRRCPLLEAAHQHPEVVCGVHLGLARGLLDELGAPSQGTSLHPFSERGACRLHLPADLPTARA